MMKIISSVLLSIIVMGYTISPALAQGINLGIKKDPTIKITSLPKLLGGIIGGILIIGFVIALFFLFWGGIQWITSGGEQEGVEKAQKKIQAAIIGLIILAAIWALFTVVGQWLGFDIENLQLPNVQGN